MTPIEQHLVRAICDLLYSAGGSVVRPGFYNMPRERLEIAIAHYLDTGENTLPEHDALTHATWSAPWSRLQFDWGPENEQSVTDSLCGKTFWDIRTITTPETIADIERHLDILAGERERKATYEYRRRKASTFTSKIEVREAVFVRDGRLCRKCRATSQLTLDHIVPVKKGGQDHLDNLQVLCRSCNSRKRDRG